MPLNKETKPSAQSVGAIECIDCISAEGYDPLPNEYSGYDTKSAAEAVVMLEPLGMRRAPLLPLPLGPLWPE